MPTLLEVLDYTNFAEVPGSFVCSKSPLRTEQSRTIILTHSHNMIFEAPFSLLIKCTMRPDSRFAFRSGFVAKPGGASYHVITEKKNHHMRIANKTRLKPDECFMFQFVLVGLLYSARSGSLSL